MKLAFVRGEESGDDGEGMTEDDRLIVRKIIYGVTKEQAEQTASEVSRSLEKDGIMSEVEVLSAEIYHSDDASATNGASYLVTYAIGVDTGVSKEEVLESADSSSFNSDMEELLRSKYSKGDELYVRSKYSKGDEL